MTLDYIYGWRWLLPIAEAHHVALIGFSEEERSFWRQVLPKAITSDEPESAPVWLVQDVLPGHQSPPPTLQTVGVVGSRQVVAAWRAWLAGRLASVHSYGLLPARRPRVVIPLGVPEATRQALTLHRPGRRLARFAVLGAGQLARFGWNCALRRRGLFIATNDVRAMPLGARQAALDLDDTGSTAGYALYLGNPEPRRKTVVLPLSGSLPVILKVAESTEARISLGNEAAALQDLCHSPLAGQVPRLLKVVDTGRQITLHQEFRPRLRVSQARLEAAVLTFLAGLSRHGRESRPLTEVLKTLPPLYPDSAEVAYGASLVRVRAWLEAQATKGAMVWGHRSHGDFAPWNCSCTAQGFFVYDWEESQKWDVAFGDAFYFSLALALRVERSPDPRTVEARALSLALAVGQRAALPAGDLRLVWALWLVRRMTLQPEPLYEKLLERCTQTWPSSSASK